MEENKNKTGRPPFIGETSTETIHIRPWTKNQLECFIAKNRKTYDSIITWLISEKKKEANKNGILQNQDIQNK